MSRHSRHNRYPHPHAAARPARPASPATPAPERAAGPGEVRAQARVEPGPAPATLAAPGPVAAAAPATLAAPVATPSTPAEAAPTIAPREDPPEPVRAAAEPADAGSPPPDTATRVPGFLLRDPDQGPLRTSCTTAQLRRFIKSRPWVPLHELRRRFGIYGDDDDVTPIRVGDQRLFIGLPPAEARMIAELLSGGDIGYEISLDPTAPIVVGVYPMRPVPRT
jgi:hypothetical protein